MLIATCAWICVCIVVILLLSLGVALHQELVKHTHDAADRSNLKMALDAMKVSTALKISAR